MIELTRLRHGEPFFLNPDLFERVDSHVDTVVHLTDGTEYLVTEPADEIVRRIVEFRARILALAAILQTSALNHSAETSTESSAETVVSVPAALPWMPPEDRATLGDTATGRVDS